MKRVVMKKVLILSLGLCAATSLIHASVEDLIQDLSALKSKLNNLSGILGTLGKKPRAEKPKIAESKDAAAKRAADIKKYANKVDYLEIPTFEDFYQAFLTQYFNKKYDESRLGTERSRFMQYSNDDINNIKDAIGRAYFEKNVLQYCRTNIIDVYDADRKQSGQDPMWVFKGKSNPNKLEDIIQNVIVGNDASSDEFVAGDIEQLLQDTAAIVVQSVDDMFYHKERQVPHDNVWCDCLSKTLADGYYSPETDHRIPKDHILYNQINYLIFEAMHVTLFHGFYFINKLILLFDFTKKLEAEVIVKNKKKFKIGFDTVFGTMMKTLIGNEEAVKKDLLIGKQLKSDGKTPVLLLDGEPRDVIYGKKTVDRDIYWCQTGYEKFPDGKQYSSTSNYQDDVTKEELMYALWYHISRHTCYSVGLLPENFIPVLGLSAVEQAKMVDIEEAAHINKDVKKALAKKSEGLKRVAAIVAYLLPRLKEVKKPDGAKTPQATLGKVSEIITNSFGQEGRAQLISITEDEWAKIAHEISQDSAYVTNIKWIFDNAAIRESIRLKFITPKDKDYIERMFAAFDRVNKS